MAKDNEYFEHIIKQAFKEMLIEENNERIILDLKRFNNSHESIKSRIILYTIKKLLGTNDGINKIHIEDIIKLCQNNIGNKYLTPNKQIKIYVNKGKMYYFVMKKT